MPSIINGAGAQSMLEVKDLDYTYPEGMDLKPGSPLHSKILTKVIQMAEDSYSVMSKRHKTWNQTDETLKVFISSDDYEKKLKQVDKRKPTSIVVPYSYATLETMMSYMTKAFLTDTVSGAKEINE